MPNKCRSNPNENCGPRANWWQESMGLDWYSQNQVSLAINFGPLGAPSVAGWVDVFSDEITSGNQNFPDLNESGWGIQSIYDGSSDYWSGGIDDGGDTGNESGVYPDDVMRTGWINDGQGSNTNLRIIGLNANSQYQLTFFGSQPTSYAGSGIFQTKYIVGDEESTLTVLNNAIENTTQTVTMAVTSNASGQINIIVTNGNDVGGVTVGVINAMVITQL